MNNIETSNTKTLKVFTVEWRSTNEDLTDIASGITNIEGYTEDAIGRALVFYELSLKRKKRSFSYDLVSTRLATAEEIAESEARAERDRLDRLMSN